MYIYVTLYMNNDNSLQSILHPLILLVWFKLKMSLEYTDASELHSSKNGKSEKRLQMR